MEVSPIYESNGHAVPSPNGQYIASQTANHLYIQYANSLETAFTFPLTTSPSSSSTSISSTATRSNVMATVQWSHTSTHVLLIASQNISLFSLSDHDRKVRISNGSSGLGRIVAAEMMGLEQGLEQVIVVRQFGRVAVWDVQSGRAAEDLGEVKLASGKLSSGWGVRRAEGKTEVLAMLGRQAAQDTLTLFLPPSTTPFKTIVLPTIDAVSITWSENWLAVLDSPLASPAPTVYIYTIDGHLFRSYPVSHPQPTTESPIAANTQDQGEPLGPRSLAFSPNRTHLALASSISSQITLLPTRTFTTLCALDPSATPPDFCHQEVLTAKSKGGIGRKYQLLASNAIPYPPSGIESLGPVVELKWSHHGKWLSVRYENQPSAIFVWQIPSQPKTLTTNATVKIATPIMLLQHAPIKKLTWHPLRPSLLLIETEDDSTAKGASGGGGRGIHIFDAAIDAPPLFISHAFTSLSFTETGRVDTRWSSSDSISLLASGVDGESREKLRLLVSSRRKGWFMIFPEGRERDVEEEYPETSMNAEEETPRAPQSEFGTVAECEQTSAIPDVETSNDETGTQTVNDVEKDESDEEEEEEGDTTQDSLYDILTGRTPLPALAPTHASYPSHHGSNDEETMTTTMAGLGLDDTFREQRGRKTDQHEEDMSTMRPKGLDGSFDMNDIDDEMF